MKINFGTPKIEYCRSVNGRPFGQWKVLDLTYAQGMKPAIINPRAGTQGQTGYWEGCLKPYGQYVKSQGLKVDRACTDVMSAYERKLSLSSGN